MWVGLSMDWICAISTTYCSVPKWIQHLIAKKVIYSSKCISTCNTFNVFNMHYKKNPYVSKNHLLRLAWLRQGIYVKDSPTSDVNFSHKNQIKDQWPEPLQGRLYVMTFFW
jgi:hypothetical protein